MKDLNQTLVMFPDGTIVELSGGVVFNVFDFEDRMRVLYHDDPPESRDEFWVASEEDAMNALLGGVPEALEAAREVGTSLENLL